MSIKSMTKEDLELLSYKDITNMILEEGKAQNTPNLFKQIAKLLELSDSEYESKIGDYYMMLTTDKRFILLDDGKWDLRSRHTSDKIITIDDEEDDAENDESLSKNKDDNEDIDDDDYDIDHDDDDYDSENEDLKDLVILDEDELDLDSE